MNLYETIYTLNELNHIAKKLWIFFEKHKVIIFKGDLGSGKTTLIKELCKQKNITNAISPSFSMVNEYWFFNTKEGVRKKIYHLDLYRIKSIHEAIDLGIEELFNEYCFIEWGEILEPILPLESLYIKLNFEQESLSRSIVLSCREANKHSTKI